MNRWLYIFLRNNSVDFQEKLDRLLNSGYVVVRITENVTVIGLWNRYNHHRMLYDRMKKER